MYGMMYISMIKNLKIINYMIVKVKYMVIMNTSLKVIISINFIVTKKNLV